MTEKSRTFWNWSAMVCALVASGIHIYLANHHYNLVLGSSEGGSICNINQTFNCDAVNLSSYSEFLKIPIAVWGAATNTTLLLLLFWNGVSGWNPFGRRIIF